MKKKLLYGLVGLVLAMSLVGFVACSDDDDDGGKSDSSKTADAVYNGEDGSEDEESAFTSFKVTYNSKYVATKIVAVLGGTTYTFNSSDMSSWDDDGVTYYWVAIQLEDKRYELYVYHSEGQWCYYYYAWDITPYTASWGGTGTNALSAYTVTVYADEDDVWWVEVTDGSTYYYPSTSTSGGTTTCSFTVAGDDDTSTVYSLTFTYDSSKDAYTYTYDEATGYEATGALSQTVLVTVEDGSITAVTVGGTSATVTSSASVWTYGGYTLTFEGSGTSYTYSWTADLSATGALTWSMNYDVVVNATVTSAGEVTINSVTVEDEKATKDTTDSSVWAVTVYSVEYTLTVTVSSSGSATYTTATTPTYSGSTGSDFSSMTVTYGEYGSITEVTIVLSGETYTFSSDDIDSYECTLTVDDSTVYLVSLPSWIGSTTYDYNKCTPVTASWGGDSSSETNALSDCEITVYVDVNENVVVRTYVDGEDISDTQDWDDETQSYTYVYADGDTEYTLTFAVSESSGSYTASYTYTSTGVVYLAASSSQDSIGDVTVKYSTTQSKILAVTVVATWSETYDGETYTYTSTASASEDESDNSKWTVSVNNTTYALTVEASSSKASYTYTYTKNSTSTYEASGEIEGVTVTVYANMTETFDGSDTTCEMSNYWLYKITDSDGNSYDWSSSWDDETQSEIYSFTVEDDDSATIYTIALGYSTTDGLAFTYTYESVTTAIYTAEGALDETVKVYYNTSTSSIEQVTVDGESISYNENADTYSYSLYNSDGDYMQYTLAVSVANGAASYSYTKSGTSTYEASGQIEGVTVTVRARVTETNDGSSSTYDITSYYLDEITDSDGNAYSYSQTYDSDTKSYTYTFSVEDDDSAVVYTFSLGYSTTSDGVAFSYTYTSATTTIYEATGILDETVLVYYDTDNSSVEKVTVDGESTSYNESEGTYSYSVHSDDGSVEYALDVSVASGKASYTTTIHWGADDVSVTVDSSGEITAVTYQGGEATASEDSNYVWTVTSGETLYTLTIADGFSSYTFEESGSVVSGSLNDSNSSGASTTLTAPSGVSKITIKWTYDDQASSSDTTAIYLGSWAWQVNFGANSISSGATSTLTITESGTSCDDSSWIYDQTNSSSGTTLTLSDIVDTYSGEFTLYLWSSNSTTLHYTVTYTTE